LQLTRAKGFTSVWGPAAGAGMVNALQRRSGLRAGSVGGLQTTTGT
jgi:hypothetical protein